jgi:hypothetical protein
LRYFGEQIACICVLDPLDRLIEPLEDASGIRTKLIRRKRSRGRPLKSPEPAGVPEFVCEISTLFNLLFVEPNVLAMWRDAHEPKSETIGAIVCNQVERIRRIPEALGHLAPLQVPDRSCEVDIFEWNSPLIFKPGHDHACDPEEDDVRRGH